MGISSSKSTNKPIYGSQLTGAANSLTNSFNTTLPKVQAVTDQITGLVPGMIDKYNAGDAGVNAARGYITDTLGSDGTNPHLQDYIHSTQSDVANQLGARLQKMGLGPAGSTYQGAATNALGRVSIDALMKDYNDAQARKAQAAGLAPGVAAADTLQIAPLLGVADAATAPLQAAAGYASGIGGLLGQYQKTKTTPGIGGILGGLAGAGLSGWASGGFKGI